MIKFCRGLSEPQMHWIFLIGACLMVVLENKRDLRMINFENIEIIENNVLGIDLPVDLLTWFNENKKDTNSLRYKEIRLILLNDSGFKDILEELAYGFYLEHFKLKEVF